MIVQAVYIRIYFTDLFCLSDIYKLLCGEHLPIWSESHTGKARMSGISPTRLFTNRKQSHIQTTIVQDIMENQNGKKMNPNILPIDMLRPRMASINRLFEDIETKYRSLPDVEQAGTAASVIHLVGVDLRVTFQEKADAIALHKKLKTLDQELQNKQKDLDQRLEATQKAEVEANKARKRFDQQTKDCIEMHGIGTETQAAVSCKSIY